MGQVVLKGINKFYESVHAVKDFNLQIRDKEFVVFVGPSGCGKTTTLRMIAGLEAISSGDISIDGNVINELAPMDRDIAMVFQSYALYPHMTVRRNIEFPLRSRGVSRDRRDALVGETAAALDLTDLLGRKPSQLSGGQRQRVALARAIVRQPVVFLMDEPLSNLDAKLRVQMRAELVDLHRRLPTTVVYVTHDQVEAMTMGRRIAVLDHGALQQVGPPQEVYDRPANLFVARFIGSPPMNTIAGAVSAGAVPAGLVVRPHGRPHEEEATGEIPVPEDLAAAVRVEGLTEVVAGVRPEDLVIAPGGSLPATVAVVESLGHERHVACRLADGALWIALVASSAACPAIGEPIGLSARPGGLHIFDPADGKRLDGRPG